MAYENFETDNLAVHKVHKNNYSHLAINGFLT